MMDTTTKSRMLFSVILLFSLAAMSANGAADPVTTTESPFDCSTMFSCGDCVQHKECFWCYSSDNSTGKHHAGSDGFCDKYPIGQVWPTTSTCSLSNARYGVCWLNMTSLIIAIVIIVVVLFLAAVITCYCCCCNCNGGRSRRQEERYRRELEARRQVFDERRAEREERRDEVRRKYALRRGGGAAVQVAVPPAESGRYNRFDNEMDDRRSANAN